MGRIKERGIVRFFATAVVSRWVRWSLILLGNEGILALP